MTDSELQRRLFSRKAVVGEKYYPSTALGLSRLFMQLNMRAQLVQAAVTDTASPLHWRKPFMRVWTDVPKGKPEFEKGCVLENAAHWDALRAPVLWLEMLSYVTSLPSASLRLRALGILDVGLKLTVSLRSAHARRIRAELARRLHERTG